MRTKTKRIAIDVAAAVAIVGAVALVAWAITVPPELPVAPVAINKSTGNYREKIALPTTEELAPLMSKRLQGPLPEVAPLPAALAEVQLPPPKPWPELSLDCILYGDHSKFAVLISGESIKTTCRELDRIGEVLVKQIESDYVVVEFQGDAKTLWIKPPKQTIE